MRLLVTHLFGVNGNDEAEVQFSCDINMIVDLDRYYC